MSFDKSLLGKRWNLLHETPHTSAGALLQHLLRTRQITTNNEDPYAVLLQLPNLVEAVQRINTAVEKKETIATFGDYDCDGITGTAQLVRMLRRRGVEPIVRLPHRERDGYGMRMHQVEEFVAAGVQLLITVDTGVSSAKEIAALRERGIDVIVTDHHHVPEVVPDAIIVHPALNSMFPGAHPSGSGVAHGLVAAMEGGSWNEQEEDQILAMLGTVADLVPLRGVNRALTMQGLTALKELHQGPLAELRDLTRTVSSIDVAFRMAPRINAAGRMEDPLFALNALLHGGNAITLIDQLNSERQQQTLAHTEDAVRACSGDMSPLLFYARPNLPHGIIGLIAGRLTEHFGKPSCVVRIDDAVCTGSLRSPGCYDIVEGLTRCSAHLETFGGHAQAGGCTLQTQSLRTFEDALTADVAAHTSPEDLVPTLALDAVLTGELMTVELCKALEMLQPYGQGNREPHFLLSGVQLSNTRVVGQEGTHLQATVGNCKAIAFRMAHLLPQLAQHVDIACKLSLDTWNGRIAPQVVIEDMRVSCRAETRQTHA